MVVNATFSFLAKNPPSMCFAGAILMWILAASMESIGLEGYDTLNNWAPFLFVVGIVLQVMYLLSKYSGRY